MNAKEIQRLLHRDCKDCSGGITSLAYTLAKSPVILSNKLNPDCEVNHLSFIEAVELIEITQSKRTLSAMAEKIEHILVPAPQCGGCCRDVVLEFVDIATSSGKVGDRIKQAVNADSDLGQDLSARERKEISQALDELIAKAICLRMELNQ